MKLRINLEVCHLDSFTIVILLYLFLLTFTK